MTIKEIESLSCMTRANIRFYESEGLLSPVRMENGYRDYSEKDLAVLKKICLLRALGVSVEEIKNVQDGQKALSDVLRTRQVELEKEQNRLEACQRVCREMQEDRVRYDTLNAQKYLDSMNGSDAVSLPASDQAGQPWAPWRRYFARVFDLFLAELFWRMLLVPLCSKPFFDAIPFAAVSIVTMLCVEPLFLFLFRTTPGKWLMGIKITDELGGRLSYSKGFKRTLGALWWGAGMGIPVFSLVRLCMSYYAYYKDTTLAWEYDSEETISGKNRTLRGFAMLGASLLLIFCFAVETAEVTKPLHQGDLTVAQFAENFNRYSWYYYGSGYNTYLDTNGQLAHKEHSDPNVVYVDLTGRDGVEPTVTYTEQDGVMTGMCMETLFSEDDLLVFDKDLVELSLYSFLLARPDWTRGEAVEILTEMTGNYGSDYKTTAHGMKITHEYLYDPSESSSLYMDRFTMKQVN